MQAYSPFNKTVRELQSPDLAMLKQSSEGWYIEYKREMPSSVVIAKSLSAFANTYGGWLFIGISEESKENPVAGAYPGVDLGEVDAALQRIRKSAADLLNPSPHFETKVLMGPVSEIGLLEDRAVICVWIPISNTAPHIHKSGNIYRRVSDASEPKPENDRFVLDQLWQRANELKGRHKEWYDHDPEFSDDEKLQPFVRVMLIADKWAERDTWVDAKEDVLRAILGETGGVSAIPFDTFYTSSEGFVARQLSDNDPHNHTLTWRLRRNLVSDLIIPLPLYQPTRLAELAGDLSGYNNAERFIRILGKYYTSKIRVVDLNYLFNILLGVAQIQKRLCELAGWSEAYHVKIKVLNAWRTIPFMDVPAILDRFEKHGPAMCLDSISAVPRGSGPDDFMEVSPFIELENDEARLITQAVMMFTPLAVAFGIPTWIPYDEKDATTHYISELQEAGRRAINEVQRLRNANRRK